MKLLSNVRKVAAVSLAVFVSANTYANDRLASFFAAFDDAPIHHEYRTQTVGRHADYGHLQPIQLRVKLRANGAQTLRLRKLLRDYHGLDTQNYRLRGVTIGNKNRYPACAELSIGGRTTGAVDLNRGVTYIRAPRGHSEGKWVLNTEAARVRWITFDLVPKKNRHASNSKRGHADYRYDRRDHGYNRRANRYDRYNNQRRWY